MFKLGRALEKLYDQQIEFPINIAYEIYRFQQRVKEMEAFILNRLSIILGEGADYDSLTEEQKMAYDEILSEEVNIDIGKVDISDILSETAKLNLADVEILDTVLKER